MKYLILLLIIVGFGLFIYKRVKERKANQEMVGFINRSTFRNNYIIKKVRNKAEYTDTSLLKMTLLALFLMIPGVAIGALFHNMELGLIVSSLLGALPYLFLFFLERKKQRLILKNMVPYLTTLEWEYESNSYDMSLTLSNAASNCPVVIKDDYNKMLQKIASGIKPSVAMKDLASVTRSTLFKVLAGILSAQETRNDPKSFKKAIKLLMKDIVKTNNRLSKVQSTLMKMQFFLYGLIAMTVVMYWMSFFIMKDPMGYFLSPKGASSLVIGAVAIVIPILIFLMSALRRRF